MLRKTVLLAVVIMIFGLRTQLALGQSDEQKWEVGGQFSFIRLASHSSTSPSVVCIQAPCPGFGIVTDRRETEYGGGGRFGYNFSKNFALEAEGNFLPSDRDATGGRKLQGVFGAKVGKRFDTVGLFAKARPGFVRHEKGDYRQTGGCIAIFPPPIACFQPVAKTSFAMELGGVFEWYPSKRVIVRFDAGDTIINFGNRNVAATDVSPGGMVRQVVVTRSSETTHNFQGSIGVGYRF
jgi:hypothetical protein